MDVEKEINKFKTTSDNWKKKGFEAFMDDPIVRVLISMIPEGDNKDALKMLLESSFEKGFIAGQSCIMITAIEHALKQPGGET